MKGIICEQIDQFKLIEMEGPPFVQGEALIRVKRIGICGTDLHAYKGNQPFFSYPRVLGHELAGVIEQIGDNEAGLKAGDQVSVIPYMHCGSCVACRRGKTNCCTDMKVLGVHIDGGMRELISVPTSHLIGLMILLLIKRQYQSRLVSGHMRLDALRCNLGKQRLLSGQGR